MSQDDSFNPWGLESPSKFLKASSPGFSSWPSTGLTPSILQSIGSRGFTPSYLTLAGDNRADQAPSFDYFSFGGSGDVGGAATPSIGAGVSGKRNSISGAVPGAGAGSSSLFSDDFVMPPLLGRKRALSTPAISTPGGSTFPFASGSMDKYNDQATANYTFGDLVIEPASLGGNKRMRMDADTASPMSSLAMTDDVGSRSSMGDSPASSMVLTPRDSSNTPLPPVDPFAFEKKPFADEPYPFTSVAPTTSSSSTIVPIPLAVPSTYSQFTFPTSQMTSAPQQPFLYELEQQRQALIDAQDKKPDEDSKAAAAAASKKKKGRKAAVKVEEEDEESAIDAEQKRKEFLERNRIAAKKSRSKKKERVNLLEQSAADLSSRAASQQKIALSLQSELRALRAQLSKEHDVTTCNCEHIKGYLEREAHGGGIPVIEHLAGNVLKRDYTNVPTMGSTDDVYAEEFANGAGVEVPTQPAATGSKKSRARSATQGSAVSDRSKSVDPTSLPTLIPSGQPGQLPPGAPIPLRGGYPQAPTQSLGSMAPQDSLIIDPAFVTSASTAIVA